jgi:tetratricopeptide (TPR) repeat protein
MKKSIRSVFVLLAAGLLILAASSCSRQARAARHLATADSYFASRQFDEAEIEYKNVLQIEALNPQAISRLGIIYFDQGRIGRTAPFLLKGRELQPNNLELRLKLGQTLLATGKTKEARDEADFILSRNPQDDEAPLLLAEAAVQPREIDEARQRLQGLPPPAAARAPVLIALGSLDFRQHKFKEAEAAFTKAQTLAPESTAANSALGIFYWSQNDLPRAEKALAEAARLAPPRSPKRLQYAQFKIQHGELETGRGLLKEMTLRTPDFLPAWIRLAEISAAEKKYDESAALLAKALARDPLLPDALLLSARLRLAKGENDKAVAELERMKTIYPNSPQVVFQLGLAYLASGDTEKTAKSLSQAVAMAPGFTDAVVGLAGLNIRKGDFSAAIAALKPVVQQRPGLSQAWLLLADAYRGQGNLDDAIAVYRRLSELFPKNAQSPFLMGLILVQQKKPDEARLMFSKTLELAPDYLPALEQLVDLDLAGKQFPVALQRVQDAVTKSPKAPGPQMLLAKIFLAQNDTGKAEAALQKAIELQPDLPTAYFLLARLYVSTNQHQKALANLNQVLEKNPKNVGAQVLVGVIQDQQKDYVAARAAYEKILAIDPKSTIALNNLAYLYSERFDQLDKAYEMAQKARLLRPEDPQLADTLGWIMYKKRQYPQALSLLQESAGKLPTEPEVRFHLGMTQYMLGAEEPARAALELALKPDKEFPGREEARKSLAVLAIDAGNPGTDARAALEKTVADRKDDPVANARLAAVYEREGAVDKAIKVDQAAIEANPGNVQALMSLVRIYTARHDTAKAFDLAKSARKLAPDDPAIAHVLGRLAFQTGDYQWAYSLLLESARKQPDNPETAFDLAEAAYSVGRVVDAQAAMQTALQAAAPFSRADQARLLLEMIALSTDPSQARAATSRIEQVLKSDPDYVPALEALAAASEQKADPRAAKLTYEKVLTIFPDFSPAKRSFALLCAEDSSDDKKAYSLASKAREAFPDDPELAKAFGVIVYRQGEFARAAGLLQESAGKRKDDPVLLYYLGMAQNRLKKKAESKEALQRALELNLRADLATEARKTLAEMK